MLTDAERRAARKALYLGAYPGDHAWQDKPGPAQTIALLRGVDQDDTLTAEVADWLGYRSAMEYVAECCRHPEEVRRRLYEAK
jgi:hypothetical protein